MPRKAVLLSAAPPVKCPSCGAVLSRRDLGFGGRFFCSRCGQGLQVRPAYFRILSFFALVISALISYAFGARGNALMLITMLALVPMTFIVSGITLRLFPPDIEVSGDVSGILHGVLTDDDVAAPAERSNQRQPNADHPAVSTLNQERWSFEGVVIALLGIAIGLFWVWSSVAPAVYRALPELGATRRGPTGFPVTVHIGRTDLAFTNGSVERWVCDAVLGRQQYTSPTFTVEAGGTNRIPYAGFLDNTNRSGEDDLSAFARDTIRLQCTDESQRTHSLDID